MKTYEIDNVELIRVLRTGIIMKKKKGSSKSKAMLKKILSKKVKKNEKGK